MNKILSSKVGWNLVQEYLTRKLLEKEGKET